MLLRRVLQRASVSARARAANPAHRPDPRRRNIVTKTSPAASRASLPDGPSPSASRPPSSPSASTSSASSFPSSSSFHEFDPLATAAADLLDGEDVGGAVAAGVRDEFRTLLYPGAAGRDPVLADLERAASVDQVFDVFRRINWDASPEHTSQALVTLWDLQKVYFIFGVRYLSTGKSDTLAHKAALMRNYATEVSRRPEFDRLLELLSAQHRDMSDLALSCLFLYLPRMGVPAAARVLSDVYAVVRDRVGVRMPLAALSRLSVAVSETRPGDNECVGRLLAALEGAAAAADDAMRSLERAKLVATGMLKFSNRLSKEYVDSFVRRCEELVATRMARIEEEPIDIEDLLGALKILRLFSSLGLRERDYSRMCRSLLELAAVGPLEDLCPRALTSFVHWYNFLGEPVAFCRAVGPAVKAALDRNDDALETALLLEALASVCSLAARRRMRPRLERLVRLDPGQFSVPVFRLLRHTRCADLNILDTFWSGIASTFPSVIDGSDLFMMLNKYMFNNHNLSGSYFNREFEEAAANKILEFYEDGKLYRNLHLCQATGFLLAYSWSPATSELVSAVVDRVDQLDLNCVQYLSVGMQIYGGGGGDDGRHQRNRRFSGHNSIPSDPSAVGRGVGVSRRVRTSRGGGRVAGGGGPWKAAEERARSHDIYRLSVAVNRRVGQVLEGPEMPGLEELGKISFVPRYESPVVPKLMERAKECVLAYSKAAPSRSSLGSGLTARDVNEAVTMAYKVNHCDEEVLDAVFGSLVAEARNWPGSTIAKSLMGMYQLGYFPRNGNGHFAGLVDSLLSDLSRIQGLHLISAGLLFSGARCLPSPLVSSVFTVDYMNVLDEEIRDCYSKDTYPVRVRHALMELNRSVCLEKPEDGVPWFHDKYCRSFHAGRLKTMTPFHKDVERCLATAWGRDASTFSIVPFAVTPYFLPVDFVVELQRGLGKVTKVAVRLLGEKHFPVNRAVPLGPCQLQRRHLEILGYGVVDLDSRLWNSMSMCDRWRKIQFLRDALEGSLPGT